MACDQSDLSFHEGELDRDDVRALLTYHVAEMSGASPREACHVLEADSLRDAAIRFVSLRDGAGQLLAIGALKRLDVGHGELKSMRVAPDALGKGIGSLLLGYLIAIARDAGMKRLSLETGNAALFDPAVSLYERHGFERTGPFGDYRDTPFTTFFTREI